MLVGLLALWAGCHLTNAPLPVGGPMGFAFQRPLGASVVTLGVLGVALSPPRAWRLAWLLAAFLTLASAGPNLWHYPPIEDGAFQSLRAGVPDPDRWPASAFLHAVAFAPVGVALGSLVPGPPRAAPLLLTSALAVIGSGLGLDAFAEALSHDGVRAWFITLCVPASALLVLAAARSHHSAGWAVAGQAVVLIALCAVIWLEWSRVV